MRGGIELQVPMYQRVKTHGDEYHKGDYNKEFK